MPRSLVEDGASIIAESFRSYTERFRDLTHRARANFESRDWHAVQRDSARRFDLYLEAVQEGLDALRPILGDRIADRPTWTALRSAYARAVKGRPDVELAETFFNSFTRKIFHTIGADPAVEFVIPQLHWPAMPLAGAEMTTFRREGTLASLVGAVQGACRFRPGWEDAPGDAGRVARAMEEQLEGRLVLGLEVLTPIFFRGKGAYVVGRVKTDRGDVPWVMALVNPEGRIVVDAVLMT